LPTFKLKTIEFSSSIIHIVRLDHSYPIIAAESEL